MTKKKYAGWYKNKETKEIHFRDFEERTLAEIKDRRRCNNSTGRWANKHNVLNELDNELANYRNATKDRLGL